MAKTTKLLKSIALFSVGGLMIFSCSQERSSVTGWAYNTPENGGFEKVPYEEQETGPGLVLIEGGTFTFGRTETDVTYDWNNIPRRVNVSFFYLKKPKETISIFLIFLF